MDLEAVGRAAETKARGGNSEEEKQVAGERLA